MAWVKLDDRRLVNLEKVDQVIKNDVLLNDTTYSYFLQYLYKDCDGKNIIYEQKFSDEESRDYFFGVVETNLNPIKDDREA